MLKIKLHALRRKYVECLCIERPYILARIYRLMSTVKIIKTTSKLKYRKMAVNSGLPRYLHNRYPAVCIILLAIYPVLVIPQGSSCPRKCQCIWRDSKITVDCSDKLLANIPTTVGIDTQGKFKMIRTSFLVPQRFKTRKVSLKLSCLFLVE